MFPNREASGTRTILQFDMNDKTGNASNPPVTTRFFRWLFGWRTIRRALVAVACCATLIALFYTEENWRGKRAWENAKRELEAKGTVLDWSAYIPPPVPDGQNIFKAPKMKEWFVGRGANELSKRLTNSATSSVGTSNIITTKEAASMYVEWCSQLEPDFNLIREGLKRPYAWMDGSYKVPYEIAIPNFVTVRSLAQTLAQRTHCYLLLEQPENALRDLTLLHDLSGLLEGKPTGKPMTLVAAMINVAVTGLYANTIADGLRLQAWREPQLVAIQKQLEEVNLIPFVEQAFKSEPAATCRTLEILGLRKLRNVVKGASGSGQKTSWRGKVWDRMRSLKTVHYDLQPRGWIYQNMAIHARLAHKMFEGTTKESQEIVPHQIEKSMTEVQTALERRSLFNQLARIGIPNFSRAFQTLGRNQTSANQALVVCALERYRGAHGKYPEPLNALVPQFIEKIPSDIIGGQPLQYRRTADGKFLLYSIGWNEEDDGGQVAVNQDGKEDLENGDWVWRLAK
jgi:hypothetical protein